MIECPTCKAPLADSAVVCNGCGWTQTGRQAKRGEFDPLHGLCEHVDRGNRCAAPAPYASSTQGGGPWYCFDHFPPFRHWNSTRRCAPPDGFRALRDLTKHAPITPQIDFEERIERVAIQSE